MLEIKLFRTNISILHSLKLFLLKIMRKLYHSLFFSEKAEKPVPSCVQSVFRTLLASYSYTVLTQLYLTSIFAKSHIYLSVIRILNLVLTNNAFQLFWLQVQIQGIQTRVTYTSKSPQIISFFNWNSLHAGQNSHYKAWSYYKKKQKDQSMQEISLQRTHS